MWTAPFIQELQTNSQTQNIKVCNRDGNGLEKMIINDDKDI